MSAFTFTLIVPTRHRTRELARLMDSLVVQTYKAFDVLIIDQNTDDRLVPVLAAYAGHITVRHVRTATKGAAAARNLGLQLCQGDIITFPDDDCWYGPDVLERVNTILQAHPEWAAVSGRESPTGDLRPNPRFDMTAGLIDKTNIWRRHIAFTAFMRRECLQGMRYDTTLGVGAETVWGAGEETDFLLRFLERGHPAQYEPSLVIFHPDWGQGPYNLAAIRKARRYGMGIGRIMHLHSFPLSMLATSFARPLFGGGYTLLLGKPSKAVYHWSIFVGRSTGWLFSLASAILHGPRQLPNVEAQVS
jgi:glycosyltransferase involved in cell wall biosynthesis